MAELITYQDVIDHLIMYSRGSNADAEQRDVRRAALNAYRAVLQEKDWLLHLKHDRITLDAPYSTGTLTYDHTGGASERLVTFSTALSSAAQGWAKFGTLKIANVLHRVATYESTTTVTLDDKINPGADVDAGTSFTLFRNSYPLPSDCRRVNTMNDEARFWQLRYMEPEEWLAIERIWNSSGTPWAWTVMRDPHNYAQFTVRFAGYPNAVESMDYMYQGHGRDLKYNGYDTVATVGTVSVSSGSDAVTGSSTTFTADMVGSIMRFSTDTTTAPTGLGDLNPYGDQRTIAAVGSTTSITLSAAISNTAGYTATKYTISDPVDVDQGLINMVLRRAEMELNITRGDKRLSQSQSLYHNALIRARELDSRILEARSKGGGPTSPWTNWAQRSGYTSPT